MRPQRPSRAIPPPPTPNRPALGAQPLGWNSSTLRGTRAKAHRDASPKRPRQPTITVAVHPPSARTVGKSRSCSWEPPIHATGRRGSRPQDAVPAQRVLRVVNGIEDTGFLVAFVNRGDKHHDWAVSIAEQVTEPLLTCEPVLAEAAFHLQRAYPLQNPVRGSTGQPNRVRIGEGSQAQRRMNR